MTTVALIGLGTLAPGCLGGASPPNASAPQPAPPSSSGSHAAAAARVVVRYVVGRAALSELPMEQGRCPALARCHAVRIRGSRPRRWALVAVRTLTCHPDRGGYADPAAACRALRDLARLEARTPRAVCMCPVELSPPPTATGRVGGRHVAFILDPCAACGLRGHAWADMHILVHP